MGRRRAKNLEFAKDTQSAAGENPAAPSFCGLAQMALLAKRAAF